MNKTYNCEDFNINSPLNKNCDWNKTLKQSDKSYFQPENRLGINSSSVFILLGYVSENGKKLINFTSQYGFQEKDISQQFKTIIYDILGCYRGCMVENINCNSNYLMEDGKKNEIKCIKELKVKYDIYESSRASCYPEFIKNRLKLDNVPILPLMSYSGDGIIVIRDKIEAILEIKCRMTRLCNGTNNEFIDVYPYPFDEIPKYYLPQIHMEMLISGIDKCLFVSWSHTKGINIFKVNFSVDYCKKMIYYIEMFMKRYIIPLLNLKNINEIHHNVNLISSKKEHMLEIMTDEEKQEYNEFIRNGHKHIKFTKEFMANN